ncbi:MAG TPA: sigma-70 family RNA polymerase sigma factor [Pyrinomonadaceae bacterium]|nr:sigma-70 family RNA polymerase sigma factor [Pyrinomonadaceae bacterium]
MLEPVLKRIAQGDPAAVQECLKRYGGLVWSLARKMMRNPDDAEDAVQEIFIDVWKNAERFDEQKASETTFIAMIARRRLIDKIRYSTRRLSPDSLDDVLLEPFTRADKTLETCIEAEQAAEAMRALRPEQQQVLRLSIVQGMSHQEISEATGMPLGTVKTHARRGLLQVRALMGLNDPQEVTT